MLVSGQGWTQNLQGSVRKAEPRANVSAGKEADRARTQLIVFYSELVYTGNQNQDNYKLRTIRYEVQPHFAVCTHPDSEVTKHNKLCNDSMNRQPDD